MPPHIDLIDASGTRTDFSYLTLTGASGTEGLVKTRLFSKAPWGSRFGRVLKIWNEEQLDDVTLFIFAA